MEIQGTETTQLISQGRMCQAYKVHGTQRLLSLSLSPLGFDWEAWWGFESNRLPGILVPEHSLIGSDKSQNSMEYLLWMMLEIQVQCLRVVDSRGDDFQI